MDAPPPGGIYVVHTPALHERRLVLSSALDSLGWRAVWVVERDRADRGIRGVLRRRPHPRLNRGEVDVYLKHAATLRRIAQGNGAALVLEDDALFPAGFAERFTRFAHGVPADFDFVCFGASCGLTVSPGPQHALFGLESGTRSMSGYLVTPACARVITADLDARPLGQPIDLTVNGIIRERQLRTYWSVPALIDNGSETGRFPRSIAGGRWRRLARPVWRRLARMR